VGAPRVDQNELQRRQEEERARALQLIQRQRMQQQQSGQQQATQPDQSSAAPTAAASSRGDLSARGGGVDLTFRNAPIDTVVDAIMRELGYSYVIDPQVTGNVSIFTMRQIPRAQLFGVLEQLLKMNGYAIVRQEGMYVILPIGESPRVPHQILVKPTSRTGQGTQPTSGGAPGAQTPGATGQEPEATQQEQEGQAEEAPPAGAEPAPGQAPETQAPAQQPPVVLGTSPEAAQLSEEEGVITYIIPLNYIPSDQMLTMAQAFVSGGATVVNFQPANTLIITDYRQNIQQILNLVNLLDTQYFDVNTVDLIPIRFNKAEDVAEDLGKIFAPGDTTAGVRVVAIERLNSVLVVTRTPEAFTEVKKWIARLDAPSTASNVRTYVYQVENNTAVQIAQILAELFYDGSGLPSGEGTPDTDDGARAPTQDAGFVDRNRFAGQAQTFGGSFGGLGLGGGAYGTGGYSTFGGYGGSYGGRFGGRLGGGGFGGQLGPSLGDAARSQIRSVRAGNVKIVINEFNNSLIIQGSEADIQFILDTVRQLDTLPRQVLIEAKIYSVELRDELSFGVAAFLQERGAAPPSPPGNGDGDGDGNGDGDGTGTSSTAASRPATTGSIGTDPGGQLTIMSRAFIGAERELLGIINALRRKTDVKIVESPRLLTMDGTAATINIGAEVPVTTSSFGDPIQSGTTSFINSIQFRPTGTTLLIIPRISASGVVTMDLAIEVSNATGQALTPTINRNYVQTSLLVQNGQTIGLAGLISDSEDVGRSRVPVLGDIPIVGALFGQTTRDSRRSELIIFITPHVINDVPTAAELTLDFKRALRSSYEFIERKETQEDELIEERRLEELERQMEPQEQQQQQ